MSDGAFNADRHMVVYAFPSRCHGRPLRMGDDDPGRPVGLDPGPFARAAQGQGPAGRDNRRRAFTRPEPPGP
eukprot:3158490-Alexandrium_andersonii.AAC.1